MFYEVFICKKKPQDKFLSVLKGKVLDVAVDLRKNSKTYGKHFKLFLVKKMENIYLFQEVLHMEF